MQAVGVKKSGAGLLIVSDGEVLLLLRSPKSGNPNTWGLPGGNLDAGETAIAAALREATEELGQRVPNYSVNSEITTMRGKKIDKLFIVFVVEISAADKLTFAPALNEEHTQFRWFKLSEIPGVPNLHPVVKKLFKEHSQQLADALEA